MHVRRFLGLSLVLAILAFEAWVLFHFRLKGSNLYWSSIQNAGHAILFFASAFGMYLVTYLFIFNGHIQRTVVSVAALSVTSGASVEIIQHFVGREASVSDFFLDVAGAAGGIMLAYSLFARMALRWLTLSASLVTLFTCLINPMMWYYAEKRREQRFPVIADFDDPWLTQYISAQYSAKFTVTEAPTGWPNDTQVARVEFDVGDWPGIYFLELERDWRGYKALEFEVYNPQKTSVKIVLRVNDRPHNQLHGDRFNRTFNLRPGLRKIRIPITSILAAPKDREMQQNYMSRMAIYRHHPTKPVQLFFDNFRLVPSK